MPALPGVIVNVAVWVSIKGTGVGIRRGGLGCVSRGAHLPPVGIHMRIAVVT